MYPDPDPAIPSAVALGQKGRTLFVGFPLHSPCGKSGLAFLYPRHRVYLKEPKPPLNKFVEVSATTGRFCSRCHLVIRSVFLVCDCILPSPYGFFPAKKLRAVLGLRGVSCCLKGSGCAFGGKLLPSGYPCDPELPEQVVPVCPFVQEEAAPMCLDLMFFLFGLFNFLPFQISTSIRCFFPFGDCNIPRLFTFFMAKKLRRVHYEKCG